jgi:hypothetical protein
MLDRIDTFESGEAGLGDRFECFPGRIADQMQMQLVAVGIHRALSPGDETWRKKVLRMKLWIIIGPMG